MSQVTLEQKLADCFRLQCSILVLMLSMVVLSLVIKLLDIMKVAKLLIRISSLINQNSTSSANAISFIELQSFVRGFID